MAFLLRAVRGPIVAVHAGSAPIETGGFVRDPLLTDKRRVLRYASLQLVCVMVSALIALGISDWNAARSAAAGGAIMISGTVLFGWLLFSERVRTAAAIHRALYAGEMLKWMWVIAGLGLAFAYGDFKASALLSGVLAAHAGFWIGVGAIK